MLRPPRVSALILLAWLAGCSGPKSHADSREGVAGPTTGFGRPEVEVTLGDSLFRATAGATVFIPRGTWIGFRVNGADTATIVFAFNVPGFEKCLRLLSAPVGTAFVTPPAQGVAAARRECHQVRRTDEAQ
jgi:hypothetical protein